MQIQPRKINEFVCAEPEKMWSRVGGILKWVVPGPQRLEGLSNGYKKCKVLFGH